MKKSLLILVITVFFAFSIVLAGCASSGGTMESAPVFPGSGESIVTVQRKKTMAGAAMGMRVWIDGEEAAAGVKNGVEVKLLVPDGEHTIQAGSSNVDRGDAVTFSINHGEIVFFAEPQMGAFSARFKLTETERKNL